MDFKAAAIKVHGNTYRYHKVVYTRAHDKVEVICKLHGSFMVSPANHIHNKSGCPKCRGERTSSQLRMSQKEFLSRAREKHGNLYDYTNTKYCGQNGKVSILCIKCDRSFEQEGGSHLAGRGCPTCSLKKRTGRYGKTDVQAFTKRLHKINKRIKVNEATYVNMHTKMEATCLECNTTFHKKPVSLLKGGSCAVCFGKGFSTMALAWIDHESRKRRIKIQHALKGGEYKIPGTNFRVDGYNKRSNTIFEFHGDVFHGNPKRFKSKDRPNPYSDKTAGELYKATRKREEHIKSLGYNLVVMWESDWRAINS